MKTQHTTGRINVTADGFDEAMNAFRFLITFPDANPGQKAQAVDDCRHLEKSWNSHEDLVAACKRALPWIGKMIADNGHLNSVLPNDCIGAMEQLEAALAKVGK